MKILALVLIAGAAASHAQSPATPAPDASPTKTTPAATRIAPGSKVFIEPMEGYETALSAAILNKKVPLQVVDSKDNADYVITGGSKIDKAGWAKTIFISPNPHAQASIAMKDAKSGVLVFAYNVDKSNARKGDQSTAEACAKHLKEAIEKGK